MIASWLGSDYLESMIRITLAVTGIGLVFLASWWMVSAVLHRSSSREIATPLVLGQWQSMLELRAENEGQRLRLASLREAFNSKAVECDSLRATLAICGRPSPILHSLRDGVPVSEKDLFLRVASYYQNYDSFHTELLKLRWVDERVVGEQLDGDVVVYRRSDAPMEEWTATVVLDAGALAALVHETGPTAAFNSEQTMRLDKRWSTMTWYPPSSDDGGV